MVCVRWRSLDASSVGGDDESVVDGPMSRRESSVLPDASDEFLLPSALTHNSWMTLLSGSTHDVTSSATGQMFESFHAGAGWEAQGPYCLGVSITSCSKCHNCHTVLYDEEIMAGWSADHSNLNTRCRYCERLTVPELTITLYDLLHVPRSQAPASGSNTFTLRTNAGNKASQQSSAAQTRDRVYKEVKSKSSGSESVKVAYLSPLVLRKELETMLSHEGDASLTLPSCLDKHPILYWNMVSGYLFLLYLRCTLLPI